MPVQTNWRRARRCSTNGCVEIASRGDDVALRDSHRPDHIVVFAKADFAAFIRGVKDGDFDDLGG